MNQAPCTLWNYVSPLTVKWQSASAPAETVAINVSLSIQKCSGHGSDRATGADQSCK